MRDGFKIIDGDRHVMEPADLWERYLDRPFRHYVGWLVPPTDTIGARITDATWRGAFSYAISRGFDCHAYLDDLDREGIDVAVLFSTAGLGFCWYDDLDPACAAALCRAYNNWLADYCAGAPDRLFGMMLLPLQDVALALKELHRAASELGLRGIFWRPNPHFDRLISDPVYDPLFACAEELGVPIGYHEGAQGPLPPQRGGDLGGGGFRWLGTGRVDTGFLRHAARHPMEIMGAFLTLATAGIFDRYPALRFAFLESGCGWLPNWLERMDVLAENPYYRQGYQGQVKPSEYFRRGQCYISSEAEESATMAMLGRTITEDCLMWASDYPHRDAVPYFPNTVGGVLANAHLSRAFKQKILWENPARFYNLPLESPVDRTPGTAAALRS